MKARLINNEYAGEFPQKWLDDNSNIVFAGELVSNWILTDVLPTTLEKQYLKIMFDGTTYYEGATQQEIEAYQKSLVPKTISQRQLRTQLVLSGFNLTNIQNAIDSLSEPEKSIAQIAWDYAVTFERNSQLLINLAFMLGMNENDIDNIFINASQL